jgi:hypothetical protein
MFLLLRYLLLLLLLRLLLLGLGLECLRFYVRCHAKRYGWPLRDAVHMRIAPAKKVKKWEYSRENSFCDQLRNTHVRHLGGLVLSSSSA